MLLFINQAFNTQFIQSLGWTLLHSLWQGFLIAAVGGIVILYTKKASAALRYNLLVFLLVLFAGTVATTFIYEWQQGRSGEPRATAVLSDIVIEKTSGVSNPVIEYQSVNGLDRFSNYFNVNMPLIVLIWALFFLVQFTRLLTGLNHIQKIRTKKLIEVPSEWKDKLVEMSWSIGVRKAVQLYESALVTVPLTLGLLKPVILIPAGLLTNLDPSQVESILLHELAHIRRKDYAVNLLQTFMETVFFFNPALWWLSSVIREEREACCDDIVVASSGDKASYLKALVNFHEQSYHAPSPALALANRKYYLFNRVKRMLTHENQTLNLMERSILICGIVVLSAFAFIPSTAQKVRKNKTVVEQKTAPVTIADETVVVVDSISPNRDVSVIVAPPRVPGEKVEVSDVTMNIVVTDTIPSGKTKTTEMTMKFSNISANTNNTNGTSTIDINATAENGDVYRIKKINDAITEFTVNGKSIPADKMSDYEKVFKAFDQRVHHNKGGKHQVEVDEENVHAEGRGEHRAEAHSGYRTAIASHKSGSGHARGGYHPKTNVSELVEELLAKKIISSKERVSFSMNDTEFIVNGIKQDADTMKMFREKFNIKPGTVLNIVVTGENTSASFEHNQ